MTQPHPPAGNGQPPTSGAGTRPDLPTHVLKRTRIGGVWFAAGCFAVVLLLLLIFILENGRTVDVAYFGAHGHLPLGVALLLAAVLGVLLIIVPGSARIVQLRITARRHRRADAKLPAATPAQPPAATPAPPAAPVDQQPGAPVGPTVNGQSAETGAQPPSVPPD